MLYSNFLDSRQISLLRISIAVGGLSHHELNGLFLHRRRLLITDHKDSAFDFSMMIHCKALLMVSISTTRITPSGKNQLIQYLEQAYLFTMHLGMTEKSLFTEVIMFENIHIRIRTLIFRSGRVRTNAFPIKLYGFQLHCSEESKLWKSFFSETRRELPFGFEPKTCWFVINCSIHLSYDSISRFLKFFNHF